MMARWLPCQRTVGRRELIRVVHPPEPDLLASDVFAPSPWETEQTQKLVDLYNESVAKGAGAGGKGRQCVDAATLRIYQPVLDRVRLRGSSRRR